MDSKKRRINDYIIIICLILIPIIFILVSGVTNNNVKGNMVYIEVNNNIYGAYSLYVNKQIHIQEKGIDNLIVIEDGYVYMKEANCKNQVCVLHKPINKVGQQIVCLPNKIVIEIKNSDNNDIDSLSQ